MAPTERRRGGRPEHGEPVVDRALALLGAFQEDRRSMTLAQLSRHTGIPASSALRLANRLVAWGALNRDEVGVYTIGARLWEIAALSPGPAGLSELALPHMRDLSTLTKHHVALAAPAGEEALMVLRLSSSDAVAGLWRTGARVPYHSSALGRVLLAHADKDVREAVIAQLPERITPDEPPTDEAHLRRELGIIRRTGTAVVYRSAPGDVTTMAVATPVQDGRRRTVAALAVIVPATEQQPPPASLVISLGKAAARIARDLAPARRRRT